MSILNEIVQYKKELLKQGYYDELIESLSTVNVMHKEKLQTKLNSDHLQIIAEIKSKSPSVGEISNIDPKTQLKLYTRSGAAAISILTDEKYFGGSFERLHALTSLTNVPILAKDFFIHKKQIDAAKIAGASIILLIVEILSDDMLRKLYDYATSLHLEVIIEVHSHASLIRAHALNPKIIGVNNRDLNTFITKVTHTNEILKETRPNISYISESGIHTEADLKSIIHSNIDGALIGEALMKHENVQTFLPSLQLKKG